jgi:transcriptional regulator with XRE-family HTH domain
MNAIMLEMTFPEFLEKKYLEWQLKDVGRKTIIQFAAYLGVSQPILSMWMSGKRRPGVDNIRLLVEIFGDEVYDALDLPRPNPYLQTAVKNWEFMSEEKQKQISGMIAEEAAKYEAKKSIDGVRQIPKRGKTG